MWEKFKALEPKTKWGITIVLAVLVVLAAIYGSPLQGVPSS
jgi:hypothetical protein